MLDYSVLERLYQEKIQEKYKNTNELFRYENKTIELYNVGRYDVANLCRHGFNIKDLDFTEEDLKKYKTIIYDCRFKDSGLAIIKNNYYLSIEDFNFLKENLLSCPDIIHNILQDKDLSIKLGLDKDINYYLDIGFYTSYYTHRIVDNWYNDFNEKQFERFNEISKLEYQYIENVLVNPDIKLDLRVKLLDENLNNENLNFRSIFERICETIDIISIRIFNHLINNDEYDTCFWYWQKLLPKLSINQCNVIYNKYYNKLFKDTRSYNRFFDLCCDFGRVLRKKERDLLIKKLKAPSRYNDIDRAKLKVNFTEDELLRLNTIKFTAKLAGA